MLDLTQTFDDASNSQAIFQLYHLPRIVASRTPSLRRDILILFVIPATVLTVVFATTDPATFEYVIAEPSLWGIYTSNFSHRSWSHLGSNLAGLFILGGIEYAFLTATGDRQHYIAVFLGSLLVFPLFGHLFLQFFLIHQPVFQSYEAVGFSEPLAAMAGYLPIALTTYQNRVSGLRWPILWAVFLYAGGIAWALTQIFGFDLTTLAVAALGFIGIIWIGYHIYRTEAIATLHNRLQYALTTAFVLSTYLTALSGLFPGDNIGTMVGHLAGFLPGFFIPFIILWGFSLAKPNHPHAIDLD